MLLLGLGKGSKSILGSTHVVEKLSFSMSPSILIFHFYIILGVIFYFLKSIWAFSEVVVRFKSCSGVCSYS